MGICNHDQNVVHFLNASLLQLGALPAATCMQAITSIASCVGEKPDIEKKLRESGVSDSQSCTDMVALMTSNRTFFWIVSHGIKQVYGAVVQLGMIKVW